MLSFYLRLYLFLYFILKALIIHLGNRMKQIKKCITVYLKWSQWIWDFQHNSKHLCDINEGLFWSHLVHWAVCRMCTPLLLGLSSFSPRKPMEKYLILSTTVSQRPKPKSTWEETWVCLSLVSFLFSDCNFTSLVCFYKLNMSTYVCYSYYNDSIKSCLNI